VAAQAAIPLARAWGGGDVASADGLRFVVPVRTVVADLRGQAGEEEHERDDRRLVR